MDWFQDCCKAKATNALKDWIKKISKFKYLFKKISNFDYFKNWKFFSYIKVGIEIGEKVRKKLR